MTSAGRFGSSRAVQLAGDRVLGQELQVGALSELSWPSASGSPISSTAAAIYAFASLSAVARPAAITEDGTRLLR